MPDNNARRRSSIGRTIAVSLFLCFSVFAVCLWATASSTSIDKPVRVGIFDNKPMCYLNADNKPAGIFVTVLEHVAGKEKWDLSYTHDSFSNLRQQLQQGKIDILLSTAVSDKRLQLYTFNEIDVFNNWAEVYVSPDLSLNSILDLKDKRVATLDKGIYSTGPEGIITLSEKFHLNCNFLFTKDYKSGLAAVHAGQADAAVINRLAGAIYAKEFKLKRTGIVFAPVEVRFAFNKENPRTRALSSSIDEHLGQLIYDKHSIYHKTINKALGGHTVKEVIPRKIWLTIFIGIVLTLFLLLTSFFLRWQIKRAEATISKNERKFRNLLESTNTVPWELDLASEQFTYMGKQIEDVLGYPAESWKNFDTWTERIHPEDRDRAFLFSAIQTRDGHHHDFTYRAIHQDGSERWIQDIVEVIPGAKGPQSLVGFMHDITKQKNISLEKQNLESRLNQAQKMEAIGTLAGGIAHDFNNILSAILGYSEMAREDCPDDSTTAKDLDKVLAAANRAKDLVKQILAFSRQNETEHILIQPAHLLKESLKMLRPTLPSTISITENINQQMGSIHADPTQIHQIIMNLCTNAFHAMEKTGGTLAISLQETSLSPEELSHEPTVTAGQFAQLSITDSGPGITPEVEQQIFNPYFTTKEVGKGTGMGLAIVHGIVQSYGGFISLETTMDTGTTFHVFLPIADSEPEQVVSASELTPLGTEHILFIDDEVLLAEMGKDMLKRLGYQVDIYNNSIEALEIFQHNPDQFDLVITDQTMPGMTGLDLARRMLQIRPGLPIILCTGYSALVSEAQAKAMGIREFALKPLTKKSLAKLIRKTLDPSK